MSGQRLDDWAEMENGGLGRGRQMEWRRLTSGPVHDPLDVKEERPEPHLHQQLVAVVQADAKGKVALQHSLLRSL